MPVTLISPLTARLISPAKQHAQSIQNSIARVAKFCIDAHQQIYKELWHSRDATPQEILDEIGTAGESVSLRGYDLIHFLLGANSGRPICQMDQNEYQPPVGYSVNQDKSITLD